MRSSLLLLLFAAFGTPLLCLAPAWSQNPPVIPAIEKVRFFPIDSGQNDDWREFYVDVDTNPTGGGGSFTWTAQIDGTSGSRLAATTGNVGETLKVLVGDPSLPDAVKVQIKDSTGAVAAIELIDLGSDSKGDSRVELIDTGCKGCDEACTSAGASSAALESLFYRLTIGAGNYGGAASLMIRAKDYHAGLYAPSALIYVGSATGADGYQVNKVGGVIDWIRTPTTFTKIETITSTGYYISIYRHADVNQSTNTPTGTPIRKVRVHQPAANELRIDETLGGKGLYRRYKYTAGPPKIWELWEGSSTALTDAAAPRKTVLSVSTSGSVDTVNKKVYGYDYSLGTGNHLVYEEERTYNRYTWGRLETSIRVDPSGQNYQTTKTWYTTGSSQGRLQSVIYPDGYWNYYTYTTGGQLASVYGPFGDTSTPAATSSDTEWIQYTHYTSEDIFIKRETRHNNIVVALEWMEAVVGTDVKVERQRAQSSGAAWDTAANLKSIITRDLATNRMTQFEFPDGQKTTYSYAGGSYSGWTYSGETHSYGLIGSEPSIRVTGTTGVFSGSTLTEGVITETEYNQLGEILARKQTGVHPTGGTRVFYDSLAYLQDDFKRITGTELVHKAAYTLRVYDCCTLQYEVDELGMARETITDILSRIQSSNYGVYGTSSITSYVEKLDYKLDGMGRRRAIVRNRIVTDGTPATITIESNTFNKAGELTSRKDALTNETKYSRYVSGTRLHEVVSKPLMGNPTGYPTEYIQYYRDGTIKEALSYAASTALSTTAIGGSIIEWMKYSRSVSTGLQATTATSAGSAGTGASRWETTKINMIGEVAEISRPRGNGLGTAVTETFTYGTSSGSSKGRLITHVDPDGVTTRYAYSNLGEVYQTARDRNTGSIHSINLADDNVTQTVRYWALNGSSEIVERSITEVYSVNGNSTTKKIIRQIDRHRNGWKTWTTSNGQETVSELVSSASGAWTTTATHPDGSRTKTSISSGLPGFESHETASGGIIRKVTTSTFDGHRRVTSLVDYRFGTTTLGYNNRDDVTSETRPNPAGGTAVTYGYSYDSNRNVTTVTFPTLATQTIDYHANGLLKKRSGTATPTIEYVYDSFGGQLTTLKTLYGSTSQTANTTWIYDSYRGWLSEKKDHNSDGATYEYTAAGRLSKRTWDRGDYVNYSYSNAGERRLANYTDVTPGVTTPDIEYSYNRTGTLAWAKDGTSDGSTITTQRYAHNSYYLTEHPSILNYTLISGVHTEDKYLRQRYDTGVVNRPAGYQLGTLLNADSDMETTYAYVANDGRLSQVTTESFETHVDTFTYSYGSAGQYGPTLLSGPQIYSAKSYLSGAPYFDIIDNKTSSGGSTVAKADYRYDTLGRRDRKDFSGSAYGSATYDTYGYNVNFEVTQGKRFTSGGAAVSGKEYNFTYDDIGNRLTSRDKYTTSAYDTAYTPNARNQYSGITGYHAASPVTYDTDGNLSALGTKTFLYNGENQLIEVKVGGSSVASFKYDYLGRRVEKSTPSKTETYAYDGWNLIALYDTGTGDKRPLIAYSWGLDLSDTMQGAGGVGGLLMSCERDGTAWTYFEDGHGNVTQVISQSTGSVNTHMEYDPYGNLATTPPTWDRRNAIRFSSKFYDDETGLYYYGFRYYDSVNGRWLTRDPIAEGGGINIYSFVFNNPKSYIDVLGRNPLVVPPAIGEALWGVADFLGEIGDALIGGNLPRTGPDGKSDFVDHYYNGDGADFDLFKRGYGDRLKKAVDPVVIKSLQGKMAAISNRLCGSGIKIRTVTRRSGEAKTVERPDLTKVIFSVGDTTIVSNADGELCVDCDKRTWTFKGKRYHSVDDWFNDPLNLDQATFGLWPGSGDLPFSEPYKITGNWDADFNSSGSVDR